MNNIIYVDVLIAINLFVNYFLLLTASRFSGSKSSGKRLLLGAGIGSLSALIILLPQMNFILIGVIKMVLSALIVIVAFGYGTLPLYLKNALIFWGVSFAFGGIIIAVWVLITPSGMYYKNGAVYFNISALALAVSAIAAYAALAAVRFALNRRITVEEKCRVFIEIDGKELEIDGLIDTGNLLEDTFTGLPVIICTFDSVKRVIPSDLHTFFLTTVSENLSGNSWASRIRIIPYNSIGTSGKHSMLAAFMPDKVYITDAQKSGLPKKNQKRRAFIGVTNKPVSDGEYHAIVGRKLII